MKIRSRWLTRCLAWLAVRTSQLLFRTCRLVYFAPEPWMHLNYQIDSQDDRRGVMCVWHDVLLIPTICTAPSFRRQTCSLISQHQDGSYLAEAMKFLGYTAVRGSTKRGGASALKQLLADTAGKHIVITPDGPRGPRRQMKAGAVYVASQTGRLLFPSGFACRSCWRIPGSWTDMVIPKPFTTVYLVTGSPIIVPPDLSREELDRYISQLQTAMDRFSEQAERLARGEIEQVEFGVPATRAAA